MLRRAGLCFSLSCSVPGCGQSVGVLRQHVCSFKGDGGALLGLFRQTLHDGRLKGQGSVDDGFADADREAPLTLMAATSGLAFAHRSSASRRKSRARLTAMKRINSARLQEMIRAKGKERQSHGRSFWGN